MELSTEEYENSLAHYGILRKSGRYPWGSGNNPSQRSKTFLDILEGHKREGLTDSQIAALYDDAKNGFPFSVADLRAKKAISVNIQKQDQIRQAQRLKDKGMGDSAIGRQMGLNESTVRSLLEPGRLDKLDILHKTADMLKRQVAEKGMIDVGIHVERDLPIFDDLPNIGISRDKLATAVSMLKEEGYQVHTFDAPQQGTGEMTKYKVLIKGNPKLSFEQNQKQAWLNRDNVQLISEKSVDGGRTYHELFFQTPKSVSSRRIGVNYKEDGGADADGVIYVRPGVKDVSLGKNQYAQVRIAVDGTHFLKGMAIYKNDLPPGVDLVFNTNKSKKDVSSKLDVMKPLKKVKENGKDTDQIDWKNPFGAFPKVVGGQLLGKNGKPESAMNILNEQGDWDKWSRTLSSQVLSKQHPDLAKAQLALTHDRRRQEFEEIKALTNPLIKQKLLESFSDEVDSSAVHLKAANMPRQATKVLFPVTSMKENEVYAPTFRNGERVSLVRFPHAGTFEIPQVTVNNNNPAAKRLFSRGGKVESPDAIGIHPKVAERLSGADFDGDAVVVIPHGRISSKNLVNRDPLAGLKGFDPQKYKVPTPDEDPKNGWKTVLKDTQKNQQMGKITNLISDMTIKGAKDDELARAVRHSMVVIDSEKHNLDYKASERDHGIIDLKKKYQGVAPNGQPRGASTLITRATSEERVPKRKDAKVDLRPGLARTPIGTIDKKTGEKVFELTGETDPNGNVRRFRSRKLAETTDAFKLVSDHGGQPIEKVYAEHSNRLKALANEARRELVRTETIPRSPSAARVYNKEVQSLKSKLNEAQKNAPLERRAQRVAAQIVAQRRRANPDMEEAEKKKIRGQALEEARARTGAKKARIDITDREWDAIQAGAISKENLKGILSNTDMDKLKERATPRKKPVMTDVMTRRAQQMRGSGATYAEIADALGIPQSTLQASIGGG